MNEDELHYLGGQFDADGCVLITLPSLGRRHLGFVTVKFEKSIKNRVFLHWLIDKVGGKLKKERQHPGPNVNNSQQWILEHSSAVAFCGILKHYSILKRNQLTLAAAFPSDRVKLSRQQQVIAWDDKGETLYDSVRDCARAIGRADGAVAYCIKARESGKDATCAGYCIKRGEQISRDVVADEIESLCKTLQVLKKTPDDTITFDMRIPYVAGFVDGDGCLQASRSHRVIITVQQKYGAIREALLRQFGGNISGLGWALHRNADLLLEDLTPFLIEKKPQALLLLKMCGNGPEVAKQLRLLKGNKGHNAGKLHY